MPFEAISPNSVSSRQESPDSQPPDYCGCECDCPHEVFDVAIEAGREAAPVFEAAGHALACRLLNLPLDREGDVAIISDAATALGSSKKYDNLVNLEGPRLRSHGGITEQTVPFGTPRPLSLGYEGRARTSKVFNYNIFDFTINGTI